MDPKYSPLFQGWEIAVAKKVISKHRSKWPTLAKEEFEDLLQECLTHWFFVKDKFNVDQESSPQLLLVKIITNKLTDKVRRKHTNKTKIQMYLKEPSNDEDGVDLLDQIANEENPFEAIDIKSDLTKALQKLTAKQKLLCQLLGEKGLTISEVSQELKIPRPSVYDEIKRIRAMFEKEGLNDYLE